MMHRANRLSGVVATYGPEMEKFSSYYPKAIGRKLKFLANF
jgi:hypothetical protein